MIWVYAFLGFAALIILHEAGHFVAAKAVGMRVERFSLFFPPMIAMVRRGETEYGIGAIPLGGYVKITGMSPNEEIPPEILPRAYYNQPVWKRLVVITAGPLVNIVIAIVVVWVLFMTSNLDGFATPNTRISGVSKGSPAASVLRPGDEIVSADGSRTNELAIHNAIEKHRCAGDEKVVGCLASTPVRLTVRRDGRLVQLNLRPRYEKEDGVGEMLVGVTFGLSHDGFLAAGSDSISSLWRVSRQTVSTVVRVFEPKERKQIQGVVYAYDYTAQSFNYGPAFAFEVLALISLSLGIINLFPFLPLDGGHIFWAIAEKVRGKRIPFVIMERAGIVGFVLIIALFAIGLSNSIHSISSGTLGH